MDYTFFQEEKEGHAGVLPWTLLSEFEILNRTSRGAINLMGVG